MNTSSLIAPQRSTVVGRAGGLRLLRLLAFLVCLCPGVLLVLRTLGYSGVVLWVETQIRSLIREASVRIFLGGRILEDPLLPVTLPGVKTWDDAQQKVGKDIWEWWLDSLQFQETSPARPWIRSVFTREGFCESVDDLFQRLDSRNVGALSSHDFQRFCSSICGDVRGILKKQQTKVPLLKQTQKEMLWIENNFDLIFPKEKPLDKKTFQSVFKLISLRRIACTLIKHMGVSRLRQGWSKPLVIDFRVNLGDGMPPFHFHSIAPGTKAAVLGMRLPEITESPENSPK